MRTTLQSTLAVLAAALVIVTTLQPQPASAKLIPITGAPHFSIVAREQDVKIANQTVHAMIYEDANSPLAAPDLDNTVAPPLYKEGIPVLVMRLNVGDVVTCDFKNMVPKADVIEGASIHWHGIELDNDSDGTAVTQDTVEEGQTYTYRFKVVRPGIFWFHSHMVPGDTLFAGMYGIIIVTGPCDSAVTLPPASATFPLALSDIQWDDRDGPTKGKVGKYNNAGTFRTINEWITQCDLNGVGTSTGNDPNSLCRIASDPGKTVLVNGYNPDTTPAPVTMQVRAGQTIRMQLFNEALSRSFYLELRGPTNEVIDLIRIGGQGGLLNNARREGGNQLGVAGGSQWNSRFDAGRIIVSSGIRFDVVARVPAYVTAGQQLTLIGRKPNDTAWNLSTVAPNVAATYPVAFFTVAAGAPPAPNPAINDGTALLQGIANCSVTNVTTGATVTNQFIDPPPGVGKSDSTIRLTQANALPSIDNLNLSGTGGNPKNSLDGNDGNGAAWQIKNLPTTRYAHVGDLLVLTVANTTGVGHPYHLHGFSFQPLAMIDAKGAHAFGYNEFLDTIDIYNGESLLFAVLLEDRPKFCDSSSGTGPNQGPVLQPCTGGPGGALGRWLYHCHIAAHGVIGMMSEIVVLGNDQQPLGAGQPPDTITPGADVLATAGAGSQTVADDFMWSNAGPITHVTLWGSWLNDTVDFNAKFELKFWTDVPAAGATPSRPGWQAWEQMFFPTNYSVSNYYTTPSEVFYNPSISNCVPPGDHIIWQYDFDLPAGKGFSPLPGSPINWVSVTAYPSVTNAFFFGWKTTPLAYGWGDDSSWSSTLYGPPWSDLHYPVCHPNVGHSMDQAFRLYVPGVRPNTPAFPLVAIAPPPILWSRLADGQIIIEWNGGGILQSADDLSGPWTDVTGATSPYSAPADTPQRLYRVRMP